MDVSTVDDEYVCEEEDDDNFLKESDVLFEIEKMTLSDHYHEEDNDKKLEIDSNNDTTNLTWINTVNNLMPGYIRLMILNNDGKPIYTRIGSDNEINILAPVITTVLSYYQNWNDEIIYMKNTHENISFFVKDSLIFVIISSNYDAYIMRRWLFILYDLLLSITTIDKIKKMDHREPSKLIEGSEHLFDSFLHNLENDVSYSFNTIKLYPMDYKIRQSYCHILSQFDLNTIPIQLILYGSSIVAYCIASNVKLYKQDFYIITNLVKTSQINMSDENWIPICLPHFNNKGFFHCYIARLFHVDSLLDETTSNFKYIALSTNFNSFSTIQSARYSLIKSINDLHLANMYNNSLKYIPIYRLNYTNIGIYNYICIATNSQDYQMITCPIIAPYVSSSDRSNLKLLYMKYYHIIDTDILPYYCCSTGNETICAYVNKNLKLITICNPLLPENIIVKRTIRLADYLNVNFDKIFIRKTPFYI